MKKPKIKRNALAVRLPDEDTKEYWKARCEQAEKKCQAFEQAFGMMMEPFRAFVERRVTEIAEQIIEDRVSNLEVESYIR